MSQPVDRQPEDAPLSIRRLTSAFAAMLGRKPGATGATEDSPATPRETQVNTRTITEALLFVGRPDNQPLSAEAIAATMRDITVEEVQQAVTELVAEYEAEGSAMSIATSAAGYRMVLRDDLGRVRDKFYGKVQQATLTPAAMEVLSVIAYRQPVTLATVDDLRRQKCQALVSSLVRRGLVRLERPADNPKQPLYCTTERFLQVFGLTDLSQLPQTREFEAA